MLHCQNPLFPKLGIDRICTQTIAFEGESIAKVYIANWSYYEEMMMEKFGKDLQPHHVKYRQLKLQYKRDSHLCKGGCLFLTPTPILLI